LYHKIGTAAFEEKINQRYVSNNSWPEWIKQLKAIGENCYCWERTKKLLIAPAADLK
jgi:hypothetical protein